MVGQVLAYVLSVYIGTRLLSIALISARVNVTFCFILMLLWCKWYHQSKQKALYSFHDSIFGYHTYRRLLTAVGTGGQCGLNLFFTPTFFFPVSSFYWHFAFMCFRPRLICVDWRRWTCIYTVCSHHTVCPGPPSEEVWQTGPQSVLSAFQI